MANFAEGTIKLRGYAENIKSALTLRYSRLNKACNLHKKLKSQKVKF